MRPQERPLLEWAWCREIKGIKPFYPRYPESGSELDQDDGLPFSRGPDLAEIDEFAFAFQGDVLPLFWAGFRLGLAFGEEHVPRLDLALGLFSGDQESSGQ